MPQFTMRLLEGKGEGEGEGEGGGCLSHQRTVFLTRHTRTLHMAQAHGTCDSR